MRKTIYFICMMLVVMSCDKYGLGSDTNPDQNFLDESNHVTILDEDQKTLIDGTDTISVPVGKHRLTVGESAWNISVTTAVYANGTYIGSVSPDSWGVFLLLADTYEIKLITSYSGRTSTYYRFITLDDDVTLDLEKIM